MKLVLESKHLS